MARERRVAALEDKLARCVAAVAVAENKRAGAARLLHAQAGMHKPGDGGGLDAIRASLLQADYHLIAAHVAAHALRAALARAADRPPPALALAALCQPAATPKSGAHDPTARIPATYTLDAEAAAAEAAAAAAAVGSGRSGVGGGGVGARPGPPPGPPPPLGAAADAFDDDDDDLGDLEFPTRAAPPLSRAAPAGARPPR